MEKTKKLIWVAPTLQVIQNKEVDREIFASACSIYVIGCHPSLAYLDSIPGKPPVETM